MIIDCETCRAPADACRDCVVTALLDRPPQAFDLDSGEARALAQLADAGLVAPLRLVPVIDPGRGRPAVSGSSAIRREIA